jgi:hypothetical protein
MSVPAPTYTDRAKLGADPTWRSRCEIAGINSATNVMAESVTEPGHTERAEYATKFLNAPATLGGPLAMAVASQPGIDGADATDSDIQFTVNALWSAMSGFSAAS